LQYRTNDYNSRVTAYIGQAAEDVTPQNIAQKLVDALIVAGVNPADVHREDGYVVVTNGYTDLTLTDSGDNSLVRSVGNVIDNLDQISSRHYVGKVVKVEPDKGAGDPTYLKAYAKDDIATGWAEVVWREAPGVIMTPTSVFCFATIQAGTLYIASSAAELQSISGVANVPSFEANKVGDQSSAPLPEFFGKRIDYMGVFQDRLIVGSGATLMFSRSGDYLNWFRKSVLTIQDDDPWEGFALGSEDDTIKYGTLYDRSLLLYGKRYQYIISGRTAFTPSTANIAQASAYEDAIDAAPKTVGNFVLYCKYTGDAGKEITSLHQVQPGIVADVSESNPISQVLDTYLQGKPAEILTMTAPNIVLLRTDRNRQRVYTYSYLDNPNTSERLFDSWSYWEWDEKVGHLTGLGRHQGDILIYMVRFGNAGTAYLSAERFVRDGDLSDRPYLDSLRPYTELLPVAGDTAYIVIGRGPLTQFLGSPVADRDTFLLDYSAETSSMWVGYSYASYVTPTNPFARDRNGQAILGGRLTLGKVRVSVTDTGAMICSRTSRGITNTMLNFTGRILAQPANMVGRQPIVTTDLTATIGGEVRECSYTLSAVRWLPLTINAIEWQGDAMMRARRV